MVLKAKSAMATTNLKVRSDEHSETKNAILGAGNWGTTLALLLESTGAAVTLWTKDEESAASIRDLKENIQFLPG